MIDPLDLRDVFDRAASLPPQERAAFLAQACDGNDGLRREVERLLAADARLGSTFDTEPGSDPTAGSIGAAAMSLQPGTRLGPYEIVAALGAGGMGVVYKARDTRLDRTVAIKVLSHDLTADPSARQRFDREARAVAALSHPHICSLFDIGHQDGIDFLVMEFLDGETLAARLRPGKLPVAEALTHAAHIADALAAAHRAGIVHRDLKPGNIILTASGVKLLDFGLAKRRPQPLASDITRLSAEPLTHTGMIVGTVQYMAPEQLEGRPVDERTDIFAFGAVLYEMVTGRRAFDAASQAALITSILRDDPPSARTVAPALPSTVEQVIRKCLAKDPEARWHSAEQVHAALAAQQRRDRPWLLLVASLLVAAAVVAVVLATVSSGTRAVPTVTAIRRLTHDPMVKEIPYSDGTRVFYTYWRTGFAGTSVFQVPVNGGESVAFPTPFANPYIYDFSPARKELLISDGGGAQLHTMPILGGQPRPVGDIQAAFVSASRDGRQIVFGKGNGLYVATADGSGVRQLLTASGEVFGPRWSFDGRIRYAVIVNKERTIWEVSADGTGAHAVLPGWTTACCGAWTPDGRYFVFEAERDGDYGLWALAEERKWWRGGLGPSAPVKLTSGPMRYENPMPAPDGRTVLALGTPPSTGELARFERQSGHFVPMLSGLAARDLDFSRDGQWITYVNHGDATLWRSRSDGSDRRQLTFPPALASYPRWSPNGTRIAYCSHETGGHLRMFVVAADGGQPNELTKEGRTDVDPSWSPDGRRLVFASGPARHSDGPDQIRIEDLQSGHVTTVPGSDGLVSPRWSPDGKSIAALTVRSSRLRLYEFSTGQWRELGQRAGRVAWPSWLRDSKHIQVQQGSMIVRVRAADGQTTPVASLEGVRQVMLQGGESWIGLTPDGAPLVLREVTSPPEIYALQVDWP